ncbi:Peroxiredoxin (EC 1.11.1.15) (plasmid) [Mycetohabitans rhizoxinica HKI 454]|uniref:Alkyl hydroperoxide reductase C n=1 Tax=Mycetohabitans rhizoxinica (strain DSM 19002 / CIP 109453 / HKI 454) TaxID=882378 RepID=E5AUT7_MYCRK|nr:Peroxiredoxin (EC 1.11.1.15) [Mycetohabitans rhizoxinica HKI 454]
MSIINSRIKPFNATAYRNGQFVPVSNQTLKDKWSVIVFYPADFTFVCPTELGDLADRYAEFQQLGVEIYSVSTDTHSTHKAWHDTSDTIGKIAYPMIGDPTQAISRHFDVLVEEEGMALRAHSSSIRQARSSYAKSMTTASAATPVSCCARCKRPSMSLRIQAKSALRNGPPARKRSSRRWT